MGVLRPADSLLWKAFNFAEMAGTGTLEREPLRHRERIDGTEGDLAHCDDPEEPSRRSVCDLDPYPPRTSTIESRATPAAKGHVMRPAPWLAKYSAIPRPVNT